MHKKMKKLCKWETVYMDNNFEQVANKIILHCKMKTIITE